MLTDTMSNEEVIHEIEKDLPQVWNYFYKKDFDKILTKKIGKRKKLQDPIEYKELYTSKNNIEWGIHLIAIEPKVKFYAIYALHRCKSGIAAYKTIPYTEKEKINWKIFSAHFFDQYYKRFLQYEFDEPLHKKEIIQEFMLYSTTEYGYSSKDEYINGLLTESSRQRLREEGTEQLMCACDDGICLGLTESSHIIYTTFISYDMVNKNQEMLVDMLKRGLELAKKGYDVGDFSIEKGRTFYPKEHIIEILQFFQLELMLGIRAEKPGQKMTEDEAENYIWELLDKADENEKAKKTNSSELKAIDNLFKEKRQAESDFSINGNKIFSS